MTHFGLICPAVAGHLNPMTTLGYELRSRGHRVTLLGIQDAEAKTLAAGLEFYPIAPDRFPLGASAVFLEKLGNLQRLRALKYTLELFQQFTALLLQELPDAIKKAGVEVMLIDQTSFGASTVADHLGLPFISISCALMMNSDDSIPPFITPWSYHLGGWAKFRNWLTYRLFDLATSTLTQRISDYCQAWNLPPCTQLQQGFSSLAQISQQPAEFEYPRPDLPASFYFTGPFNNPASREPVDFPYDQLTGQPLIYASLGTLQNRLTRIFHTIAEACVGLDVQLVIALGGGQDPSGFPTLPGSPLVVGYAPQLELLKRATLTITHAGLNTTLESLSQGVPMVAIPIANDQPGVARRIQWTGAGEMIKLRCLNAQKLRVAIAKVLTEPSYKNNALRLQQAIQQSGGVKRAADIIERAILPDDSFSLAAQ